MTYGKYSAIAGSILVTMQQYIIKRLQFKYNGSTGGISNEHGEKNILTIPLILVVKLLLLNELKVQANRQRRIFFARFCYECKFAQ